MENSNPEDVKPQNFMTMTHMRNQRFVTRISKPWDERFHVMTTKDNPKLHLFYKELFGKPSHVKHEEMLLKDKSKIDYMFGSTYTPFIGDKMNKKMKRTEQQWVSNFNVMGSKNNSKIHRHYKEFFDRPVEYDNQGYKSGIGDFGEIYDFMSTGHSKMSMTSKNSTLASFKNRMQKSNSAGELEMQDGSNQNQMPSDKLGKNSMSIQEVIKMQRNNQKKKKNFRRSLDRLQPSEYILYGAIPNLRRSKFSPSNRKREDSWKKVGEAISTFNELVHPAYKIGFERL